MKFSRFSPWRRIAAAAVAVVLGVATIAGVQKPAIASCSDYVMFQYADPGSYGYCYNQVVQWSCGGGFINTTTYEIRYVCGAG